MDLNFTSEELAFRQEIHDCILLVNDAALVR